MGSLEQPGRNGLLITDVRGDGARWNGVNGMIERLRGACRAGSIGIASVVLVAACADGRVGNGASNGDGADDLAGGEVASESDGSEEDGDFGEPTPEDTTEEAPAEVEVDSTTIEVATLPIGGGADDDENFQNFQCVDVGWSDPPDIPAGVTVVIRGLVLEPAGHFTLSDQPCPGGAPPCLPDHAVTPEQRCTVAVGWTDAAGDNGGWLSASGTLTCEADADVCSGFADAVAERGGESIELWPPRTGTTPFGNSEAEESSGSSGQGGEQGEDADQNGVEGTENGQGNVEENGEQDSEQNSEQDGADGTPENGEG